MRALSRKTRGKPGTAFIEPAQVLSLALHISKALRYGLPEGSGQVIRHTHRFVWASTSCDFPLLHPLRQSGVYEVPIRPFASLCAAGWRGIRTQPWGGFV